MKFMIKPTSRIFIKTARNFGTGMAIVLAPLIVVDFAKLRENIPLYIMKVGIQKFFTKSLNLHAGCIH
jgi:hypothetical protein